MTLRNCLSSIALLSGTSALAHDGDHAGMTDAALQLHHLGLPIAVAAIALIVIIASYRKRAAQMTADDGADRR